MELTYEELRQKVAVLQEELVRRKETEENLRRTKEFLENAINAIDDPVFIIDDKHRFVMFNDKACQENGFAREELIGKSVYDLFPAEQAAGFWKIEDLVFKTGRPVVNEEKITLRGQLHTVSTKKSLFKDPGSGAAYLIATVRDITERKRKEDELRLHSAIIHNMSEGVALVEAKHGAIVYASPKFADMFGYDPEEMKGKHVSILPAEYGGKTPEETTREVIETLNKSRNTVFEIINMRKDKTTFWGRASITTFEHPEYGTVWVDLHEDIDEAKKAEASARESQKYLAAILNCIADPICVKDEKHRWVLVNDRFCEITGKTREELIGKSDYDYFPKEEADVFWKADNEVFRTGKENFSEEFLTNYITGESIILNTKKSLYKNNEGQKFIVAIGRNVTERRKADEESKKREATLRGILQASPAGVGLISFPDRIVAWANDRFAEMLGYSSHELIGLPARQVYPSQEQYERVGRQYQEIFLTHGTKDMETQWRRKDGSVIDVRLLFIPLQPGNPSAGVVFTGLDITQPKQAGRALRESEERFRELAELMPETIFEMGKDGKLTYLNKKGLEILRVTPDDIALGITGYSLIAPEDRAKVALNIQKRLAGEPHKFNEYNILPKDGSPFPAIICSTAIIREGKPVGVRGFIIDATERKRLEKQLMQAQKMEAIGTLAGGIAHDFNNILMGIFGFTELALKQIEGSSPARRDLEEVLKASHRAKDLVSQILAFSRQQEQTVRPLRVDIIVKEALKLLRASLPTTIEIRQKLEADQEVVQADPSQVHQVLMNLCTNAAHAMREKGGVLQVTLGKVDINAENIELHDEVDPGPYLKLTVSDTGPGIPPEILDRIFEPYFTTKEKGEGTGLGLAVVHGIVKSCRGIIEARNEPGGGASFHVYLPVVEMENEESEDFDKKQPPEIILTGDENILFVDDESKLCDMMKQALGALGYNVTTRVSAVEALELFRTKPSSFDLVITDMTMPKMTGDKFAKELLKIRPHIPVILCSGFSELMTEEKARSLGIKAFVMKPFVIRNIARTIREVLASD